MRIFGANLRRLRQEANITLRQFAEEAGMSYSFLSNVERGQTDIALGNAARLSRLLDTTLREMLVPTTPRKLRPLKKDRCD
jgi:transcriptional regulator with XRE-family HTH domain